MIWWILLGVLIGVVLPIVVAEIYGLCAALWEWSQEGGGHD